MQDWSYTEGNSEDIEKYFFHYQLAKDEDKRFILMEFIIQAIEDQRTEDLFSMYCEKVKQILLAEFPLHEYTIYYWSCFDNENLDDCWRITPMMREIWHDTKYSK